MKQALYRAALSLLPPPISAVHHTGFSSQSEKELLSILRRHRCLGGVLRLFELNGRVISSHFGMARRGLPAGEDTVFRIASISKTLTALCVLKLCEEGRLSLDADTCLFPRPVTIRQLLSHTAGILDGPAYWQGLRQGAPLSAMLPVSMEDSLLGRWAYSNLGAGAVGSFLEERLGESFESIMQRILFEPLHVEASFYAQRVKGELADARRVFPPQLRPGFDALSRQARADDGIDRSDPEHHYGLAQGNCCLSAENLQKLLTAVMRPGYLCEESLAQMKKPHAAFGLGRQRLDQGLFLFGLNDREIFDGRLYGHQGKAYGAVHAAFFDEKAGRGMVFLSTGISEARRGFLADAVCDLLRFSFKEETWA